MSYRQIVAKFAAISLAILLSILPFTTEIGLLKTPTIWAVPYYAVLTIGAGILWRRLRTDFWWRSVSKAITVIFGLFTFGAVLVSATS